ncbi:hypothetical protein FRB96_007029 [Tulasnella sp. 330]|nr:hypothetical protein FRB96_007029 [Tulasnella sp. 330]KAG8874929.1 hypothetical protein FRB97_005535 [Tulasnella sp. 331]KAG8881993.1 hypothetical protein FRB98_004026 [Tulasnella sp. 332]
MLCLTFSSTTFLALLTIIVASTAVPIPTLPFVKEGDTSITRHSGGFSKPGPFYRSSHNTIPLQDSGFLNRRNVLGGGAYSMAFPLNIQSTSLPFNYSPSIPSPESPVAGSSKTFFFTLLEKIRGPLKVKRGYAEETWKEQNQNMLSREMHQELAEQDAHNFKDHQTYLKKQRGQGHGPAGGPLPNP